MYGSAILSSHLGLQLIAQPDNLSVTSYTIFHKTAKIYRFKSKSLDPIYRLSFHLISIISIE